MNTKDKRLQVAADRVLGRDLSDLIEHGADAEVKLPPPQAPTMVSRSMRLSLELDARIKAVAADRGIASSALIRELTELGLASIEDDQQISRADALRALAGVHPANPAA